MSESPNFIKKNLVLIIGLTLPLLLIILFFAATVLPKHLGTPPQYDLIYSVERYDAQPQKYMVKFFVDGDTLKARVTKNEKENTYYNTHQLMRFNPKTNTVQPIDVDVDKLADGKDATDMVVDPTKNLKFSAGITAPDGYILEGPNYHGGMMRGFFGGGYDGKYRIKKGAVAYKIPNTNASYYYANMQFVGWVIGER